MIYIGSDKHGLSAIRSTEDFLNARGIAFQNVGVSKEDEELPLQDLIPKVVEGVLKNPKENRGILSCGTGVGVEVGANKFSGIRAVLADSEQVAEWSRIYDDCNVLCLIGWNAEKGKMEKILGAWFRTEYDGSERRLKMFDAFNTWH
ncbi:MAG: RpiB/LacA/LacB family sugar-phosphate isomerase [bacterium]|nr:RpiB/LacA/LacB family sugar-phosphate isomerase [bacterium]